MKMPETEHVMMKCICNSCNSFEKCISTGTMKNMKAFCSSGDAMEDMKEKCMDTKHKDIESSCTDEMGECISVDDCVCQECPVSDEYQLTDKMYCTGSNELQQNK
jgi:hypothetical protein